MKISRHWGGCGLVLLTVLSAASSARAQEGRWGQCLADTKKIVDAADRIVFSTSSAGAMTMRVVKPHLRSTMSMKFWSVGRNKMLVRVAAPGRIKGMATLKVGEQVWYYMPRTDRVVRVETSMLSDSWMGSHWTNDDLVKETELDKHYTCIARSDTSTHHKITLKPKKGAPVVWGKVIMTIRKLNTMPERFEYHGDRGGLKRVMTFHDVRVMDGRTIPTRMVVRPAGKSEHTEVRYNKVRFNVRIPDRYFSLRGLKR